MSRKEGSLAYRSYPGRANFSYNPLIQKLTNRVYIRNKTLARLRRVTLLDGPPFFHKTTLADPAG